MQMNRKVTNGLAWAGAIVVVGVLSADFVTSKFATANDAEPTGLAVQAAPVTAVTPVTPVLPMPASARPKPVAAAKPVAASEKVPAVVPVKQAAVAPVAATPAKVATPAKSDNVVDNYLADGKALPSYLTDGKVPAATTAPAAVPAQTVASTPAATIATPTISASGTALPATDPVQVGAIAPQKIAPVPLPLSMRPKPQQQPPLIIDEATIQPDALPSADVPLQQVPVSGVQDDIVSAQDLQNWESGPLSEFLAKRRGTTTRSSATYDPDGFNLGDGPNNRSRARYIGQDDDYDGGGY